MSPPTVKTDNDNDNDNDKPLISPLIISPESIAKQEPESFPEVDLDLEVEPSLGLGVDGGRGQVTWKTLISAPQTRTDSLTAGIATCPPRTGHLCPHRHRQAEIYHVTQGHGVVEIDGVESAVQAGTVVYIPGNAKHGIRNTDPERELTWFYVFAADGFGEIQYRF
ncbi:hypothetical protein A1O1_05286 [Capronia coronata CBS 617.96]|uniref:Cupin type-2 domain-containing protein n=1 Tax=Capronia coronata CBS 617.96 TaxID=1182541 RepID=W9YGJ1_9EURO|nr:uncharacterized protein A1O1_05286 [Capronia coronata CBS 617.96]EXJ88356.1 hypothetical protein A1O1_05286 [Capronia coronata CBS 617.96]